MTKAERQKKYKQIADLAEWVNNNRNAVAEDGMNVIIAVADPDRIKRMCLTGRVYQLYLMLDKLRQGAADAFDAQFGVTKNDN